MEIEVIKDLRNYFAEIIEEELKNKNIVITRNKENWLISGKKHKYWAKNANSGN